MKAGFLYWSYIANCVFNAFLCYTAIMLNSVTIQAIRKTSSLPKTLKTLLLSLAVSDLGVGLLVQPLYIALLIMEWQENTPATPTHDVTLKMFLIMGNFLAHASFFGVTALGADRFLAIHLHLRYRELVTHKRVVAMVISTWVCSALLSLVRMCIPENIVFVIFVIVQVSCVTTAAFLNYKIFKVVRQHGHQSQAIQEQQMATQSHGQTLNAGRLTKSAITTVIVFLVFLACYLPTIAIFWTTAITSEKNTGIRALSIYTRSLVFLNSYLNPIVYSWKMRHIRQTIINTLRNTFPSLKKASDN